MRITPAFYLLLRTILLIQLGRGYSMGLWTENNLAMYLTPPPTIAGLCMEIRSKATKSKKESNFWFNSSYSALILEKLNANKNVTVQSNPENPVIGCNFNWEMFECQIWKEVKMEKMHKVEIKTRTPTIESDSTQGETYANATKQNWRLLCKETWDLGQEETKKQNDTFVTLLVSIWLPARSLDAVLSHMDHLQHHLHSDLYTLFATQSVIRVKYKRYKRMLVASAASDNGKLRVETVLVMERGKVLLNKQGVTNCQCAENLRR